MSFVLKNVNIYKDGAVLRGDAALPCAVPVSSPDNCFIFPGFTDVHVHLREPGFSYKETMYTGTRAAARGGYVCLCAMPNVSPAPDCAETLAPELESIRRSAVCRVLPIGAITRGRAGAELADIEALAPFCPAFSDDGSGVASESLMRGAMRRAAAAGRLITAHCEDMTAPPDESEPAQLRRDLALVRETGCRYHACHISKRESVELIRRAKAEGLDVTCETAPHYLLLDSTMFSAAPRFRMNPPIGSPEDRAALIAGLLDGTVDMIATDHAPHTAAEKQAGANGVVGLECAFPVLYTQLVETGLLPLARLVRLMSEAPARRFGLDPEQGDMCVWDMGARRDIDPADFLSMGRSTPFEGMTVGCRCLLTVCGKDVIWEVK